MEEPTEDLVWLMGRAPWGAWKEMVVVMVVELFNEAQEASADAELGPCREDEGINPSNSDEYVAGAD